MISASHVILETFDNRGDFGSSILHQKIVSSFVSEIFEPDSIVLDGIRILVKKFGTAEQLSTVSLDLQTSIHKRPKLRSSSNRVGSKDPHSVDLRNRI